MRPATHPDTLAEQTQAEPAPVALVNDTTPAQTEEILHRIDAQVAAARNTTHPAHRGKGSATFNALFAEASSLAQAAPPHRLSGNNRAA